MQRLLNILTNHEKRKIWILNRRYCPRKAMVDGKAVVMYSYNSVEGETPLSVEAIKSISQYNEKTFVQAYKEERIELMGYDAHENRIKSVWNFYKTVKKDDVMLFVSGKEVEGYYIVTGEQVECQNEKDYCIHSWAAETIRFSRPICIEKSFGSPYFKQIGSFKDKVIEALKRAI